MSTFWAWFSIILVVGNIVACWWLLMWTKGISHREDDGIGTTGHTWDGDLTELNHPLPRWWLYLFNITIVFALLYLVLFPGLGNFNGILGWTQVGQYDEEMALAAERQEAIFARYAEMSPDLLIASADAMDTGRRLYGNHCGMCHGSDGRGATGFPNLADDAWQWGAGYDNILHAVTYGRQAAMPPMAAAVGDEDDVLATAVYVQSLSGIEHDPALAEQGKAKFDMVCAACHMPNGQGNPALGAPNLTDDAWLYGSDVDAIAYGINNGRMGVMPAHEGILSEQERRLVSAWVLSLSRDGGGAAGSP